MSDSNCCCSCQYSTPPWWVTMGFIPPLSGGGQWRPVIQQTTPQPTSPGTPGQGVTPGPSLGTSGGRQLGLGDIVSNVVNPLGPLLNLL